jgi:hypothetical protein
LVTEFFVHLATGFVEIGIVFFLLLKSTAMNTNSMRWLQDFYKHVGTINPKLLPIYSGLIYFFPLTEGGYNLIFDKKIAELFSGKETSEIMEHIFFDYASDHPIQKAESGVGNI